MKRKTKLVGFLTLGLLIFSGCSRTKSIEFVHDYGTKNVDQHGHTDKYSEKEEVLNKADKK